MPDKFCVCLNHLRQKSANPKKHWTSFLSVEAGHSRTIETFLGSMVIPPVVIIRQRSLYFLGLDSE